MARGDGISGGESGTSEGCARAALRGERDGPATAGRSPRLEPSNPRPEPPGPERSGAALLHCSGLPVQGRCVPGHSSKTRVPRSVYLVRRAAVSLRMPMDRSTLTASGNGAPPDKSRSHRPHPEPRCPAIARRSPSPESPGTQTNTGRPRNGDSRDRSITSPPGGWTALSGDRIRMHVDTSRRQRRHDLRTGLGAGAGGIEAERGSGITDAPETRAGWLRRERPGPGGTRPRPAYWGTFNFCWRRWRPLPLPGCGGSPRSSGRATSGQSQSAGTYLSPISHLSLCGELPTGVAVRGAGRRGTALACVYDDFPERVSRKG
jgi:hypothetical protein